VLVYNSATDQMYLLWPAAAEVLKQCDGTRSAADVAAAVFPGEQLAARGGDDAVARLFGQLEKRSLVSWPAGEGAG
jgi:hypothetical protein